MLKVLDSFVEKQFEFCRLFSLRNNDLISEYFMIFDFFSITC